MVKANAVDNPQPATEGLTTFEFRLLRILALRLVQERPQPDQVDLLTRAGFSAAEIASLLNLTPNAVRVVRYQVKQSRKRKKGKKKTRKR